MCEREKRQEKKEREREQRTHARCARRETHIGSSIRLYRIESARERRRLDSRMREGDARAKWRRVCVTTRLTYIDRSNIPAFVNYDTRPGPRSASKSNRGNGAYRQCIPLKPLARASERTSAYHHRGESIVDQNYPLAFITRNRDAAEGLLSAVRALKRAVETRASCARSLSLPLLRARARDLFPIKINRAEPAVFVVRNLPSI